MRSYISIELGCSPLFRSMYCPNQGRRTSSSKSARATARTLSTGSDPWVSGSVSARTRPITSSVTFSSSSSRLATYQ